MKDTEKTGWQTDEAARSYARVANSVIPGRAETLEIIGNLTSAFCETSSAILDLGCGYGDATEAILKKAPDTSASLIDYSDEMLRRAGDRFLDNPKIRVIKYDLNKGFPDSFDPASFDVIVSCFALHHIDFERRVPLYTQIYQVLKSGGIFINGDRFAEESPRVNGWMFEMWVRWMTERINAKLGVSRTFDQIKDHQTETDHNFGDKPGSLWAMETDLRTAGFSNVDCIYKNQIVAVIAAVK